MSLAVITEQGKIWTARVLMFDEDVDDLKHCAIGSGDSSFDDYPIVGDAVASSANTGDDTMVSGGTYSGSNDEVYLVKVTKGGIPGVAEITVTGMQTGDNSGPTVVSAFGVGLGIGSRGATITPTDGGDGVLTLDDSWMISCDVAPDEDTETEMGLLNEFARIAWYKKAYLIEDASGNITIDYVRYSESPTPTKNYAYFFQFAEDQGVGIIREYAFFADTAAYNTAQVLEAIADDENTGDDVAVSGGTYVGTVNETYEVEITAGGAPGVAQITVTGLQNEDNSGPTTVTAFDTPIPIGSGGATITYPDGGDGVLTLGDKCKVACTKNVSGQYAENGVYDRDENPEGEVAVAGVRYQVKHIAAWTKESPKSFKLICFKRL
jgi:hypothetical protein